jgi:hypothetical protein
LTPGLSFAHNLGCRCPNGQCEAILDIYISRPFQWHQEYPNARCFGPFNLSSEFSGVPKDSKFPLLGVWASPSHLAQSGVATPITLDAHNFLCKPPIMVRSQAKLYACWELFNDMWHAHKSRQFSTFSGQKSNLNWLLVFFFTITCVVSTQMDNVTSFYTFMS